MSVRRVRENLTHGARWRREETSASRLRCAARAPPADPTELALVWVAVQGGVGGLSKVGVAMATSTTEVASMDADLDSLLTPTDDPASAGAPNYKALTMRRLKVCSELLEAVAAWMGEVMPSPQSPWLVQRQTELILRAIQSMQGSVLLAGRGLWLPTYALARMLIEDAAVAHWLAVHPDPDGLETRWRQHLLATHLSDIQTQEELGLELDPETTRWQREQDPVELGLISNPSKLARAHWTAKSPEKLVDLSASSGGNWALVLTGALATICL